MTEVNSSGRMGMRPQSQEIVLMFVGGQNMMLRPMDLWDEQIQRGATLLRHGGGTDIYVPKLIVGC